MECAEYRRSMMADPRDAAPQLRAHLSTCHDCSEFTAKLLRFESNLGRALQVPVTPQRRTAVRPRAWLALAASVLIAIAVGGGLWLAAPSRTLAADVINHMAEEPAAWNQTDVDASPATVAKVMSQSHLRLKAGAGLVSYANSCLFRGHTVPHLVVQTARGPVTVMILTQERIAKAVSFDEQGYRGKLLPIDAHGSLAVLERAGPSDDKTLNEVARQVLAAIEWTG